MNFKAKDIFFYFKIDAIGALTSALLLSVFYFIPQITGMPRYITLTLLLLPLSFVLFSSLCMFFKKTNRSNLLLLASMNLGYCLISAYYLYTYFHELTAFGIFYFISEKIIVLSLVFQELRRAIGAK